MSTPHRAPAWHRECNSCGIVLTVRIEDDDGHVVMRPAPKDSACNLCKTEYPGPWVAGEFEPDEGYDEDEYDDGVADRQMQSFQGIPGDPEPLFTTDAKIDRYEEELGAYDGEGN